VLLLGVAAEAVVLKGCEIIVDASADPVVRKAYDSLLDSIK
jgi:hypothetical protein